MQFIYISLALLLSGVIASGDVLIYRLSSTDRNIGGGEEIRTTYRGYFILDLDTFDVSLVRAGKVSGIKVVLQDYLRGVDVQTITGTKGRTQTVISVLNDAGQTNGFAFDFKAARGSDSLITYAPGLTNAWPKKFSVIGRGLVETNGILKFAESSATLTYQQTKTIEANTLDQSLEQATAAAMSYYLDTGYSMMPLYDLLVDMEAGNGGELVTPSILSAMTRIGGEFGSWQIRVAQDVSVQSSPLMKVSTAQKTRGSRSIAFLANDDWTFAEFTLTEAKAKCSAGFAFKLDASWVGTSYGSYDVFTLRGENGEYLICNYDDTLDAQVIAVHTSDPAELGNLIPVLNSTWYWCSLLWDAPNKMATLKLYDYNTRMLLGTSSLALEGSSCMAIQFGRTDDHGHINPGAYFYFDDIIFDPEGHYPLLPP